jgi:hypothetical protein
VVVLDVDHKRNGPDALVGREIPPTWVVGTPSGGWHYYFRHPGGAVPCVPDLLPGVDLKADGGYVLVPPSVIDGVAYELQIDEPVAPATQWLLELLRQRDGGRRGQPESAGGSRIAEGARNTTLTKVAGALRRQSLAKEEIAAALLAVNQQRCEPPLPEAEVRRIAESVARYAPASIASPATPTDAPQLLTAAEILEAADAPGPEWLVDGLLPSGGLSVLAGRPKSGKSTLARALSVAVVQGRAFLSCSTRQGAVLLITLEDRRRDVGRHLRALGLRPDDPLLVATEGDVATVGEWVRKHCPALVVVDTIGRLLKIREVSEYGHVLQALDAALVLARQSGAHFFLIHHAPKGSDGRDPIDAPLGSTAFGGTADTLLHLKRATDGTRAVATVQRVGEDLAETILVIGGDGWPTLAGTRKEHVARQMAEGVLAYLTGRGEATREEVLAGVEGRAEAKGAALKLLAGC